MGNRRQVAAVAFPDGVANKVDMGPLFTIGHSTRALDEVVRMCAGQGIRVIADVRRFPGSRRSPHFARKALQESLPAHGIDYLWLVDLGGHRRRPTSAPPSPWRVEAFAAYADYMLGPAFRGAVAHLTDALATRPTAIMCAEASPYRCHRRLISDWAELHGIEVVHLIDEHRHERHHVTAFARRDGDDVRYDAGLQLELPLGESPYAT